MSHVLGTPVSSPDIERFQEKQKVMTASAAAYCLQGPNSQIYRALSVSGTSIDGALKVQLSAYFFFYFEVVIFFCFVVLYFYKRPEMNFILGCTNTNISINSCTDTNFNFMYSNNIAVSVLATI